MIKLAALIAIVLLLGLVALGYYLFRPLAHKPRPARFHCYNIAEGSYVPLGTPPQAFGVGLSYASHIEETASKFDPETPPPIFRKQPSALVRTGAEVAVPGPDELVAAAESLEPGLGTVLRQEHDALPALLDYEVEMGFVLLDDIDRPSLGDAEFAPTGLLHRQRRVGTNASHPRRGSTQSLRVLGRIQELRWVHAGRGSRVGAEQHQARRNPVCCHRNDRQW